MKPTLDHRRNWKLVLAYDGTDFCGWQVQPDHPTIQGELSDAIERITGERVLPQGSGRTDAGVHALGQVASFRLQRADSTGKPAAGAQSRAPRIDPGARRGDCAARLPRPAQRRRKDLRIPHLSWRNLPTDAGPLRLRLELAAECRRDDSGCETCLRRT